LCARQANDPTAARTARKEPPKNLGHNRRRALCPDVFEAIIDSLGVVSMLFPLRRPTRFARAKKRLTSKREPTSSRHSERMPLRRGAGLRRAASTGSDPSGRCGPSLRQIEPPRNSNELPTSCPFQRRHRECGRPLSRWFGDQTYRRQR
jgi:hypothetical protein